MSRPERQREVCRVAGSGCGGILGGLSPHTPGGPRGSRGVESRYETGLSWSISYLGGTCHHVVE